MKTFSLILNIISFWTLYLVWLAMSFDIITPDKSTLFYLAAFALFSGNLSFIFITSEEFKSLTGSGLYSLFSKFFIYFFWIMIIFGQIIFWPYYLIYISIIFVSAISRFYNVERV